MKTSTFIIGSILVFMIFLPLVYLLSNTARIEKKIRKTIYKLSEENHIKLNTLLLNGDLILGLDPEQKKLVVSSRKSTMENFQVIELDAQTTCQIHTHKSQENYLDWVSLELSGPKVKKDIVFYREDEDNAPVTDPNMCLREAEKWQHIIRPLVKASK